MNPSRKELSPKERVFQALTAAGFDRLGVASAVPLEEDAARLSAWLEAGFQGEMSYLTRDFSFRANPSRLLPGARSVIVAAASYEPLDPRSKHVAAFALPLDYHEVLACALQAGVRVLADLDPSAACRVAVDSSPLLERAFAQRAGLGWVGYSNNLLVPGLGPYVLLGMIVTTFELEPDAPLPGSSGCSACGRCIEACPTGALKEPYLLDARKCISYLTLEKKGSFSIEEAEALGPWAFGCDLCTAACLQNRESRFAPPSPRLLARTDWAFLDLEGLLSRCESGFKRAFEKTALYRLGRARAVRNILTAACNEKLPWVQSRAARHLTGGTEASRAAAHRAIQSV